MRRFSVAALVLASLAVPAPARAVPIAYEIVLDVLVGNTAADVMGLRDATVTMNFWFDAEPSRENDWFVPSTNASVTIRGSSALDGRYTMEWINQLSLFETPTASRVNLLEFGVTNLAGFFFDIHRTVLDFAPTTPLRDAQGRFVPFAFEASDLVSDAGSYIMVGCAAGAAGCTASGWEEYSTSVRSASARQVPEPSTLLLTLAGAALLLRQRRRRHKAEGPGANA